jgi:hypothetical protein
MACVALGAPRIASMESHGFDIGYQKGLALAMEHRRDMVKPVAFIELAPVFDEYDSEFDPTVSVHKRDSRHHHHHAHGARPEPQEVNIEDAFIDDYTNTMGTRPSAPKISLPAGRKSVQANAQVHAASKQDGLVEDPAANRTDDAAADNSDKLADQEARIKELEENYKAAQARLEKYESQQSAMSAGSAQTDSAGKTEFIKGYEGGFKVGYEAGWNMATADLKKRYGFPERSGHIEEPSNSTTPDLSTVANAPPSVEQAPVAPAEQTQPEQNPPAGAFSLNRVMRNAMNQDPQPQGGQPQQPFAALTNPIQAFKNNPFFADDQQQQPQQPQQQAALQQPQQGQMPYEMPQQQYEQQAQMPQQPFGVPNGLLNALQPQAQQQPMQQAMQQMAPMPNFQQPQQPNPFMPGMEGPQFGAMDNSQPGFPQMIQQPQQFNQPPPAAKPQPQPQGLPGKAFQFMNNLKNMFQEGRSTVEAVRSALTDDQAQQQQPQMMQQQFGQQQMMQQMMPQQQPQQPNPFSAFQSLMQTDGGATQNAQGGNMLNTIAGLLSGNANGGEAQNNNVGSEFGLQNLAQLLATTTGTQSSALPQPVKAAPGADSTQLGLQEMQNMIQEGRAP